jgi:hypothetical protein
MQKSGETLAGHSAKLLDFAPRGRHAAQAVWRQGDLMHIPA